MRKEHHPHLHAGATTNSSSLPAADCAARSPPSACSSAQQAAAAWAWFQHGGSSCITPSKAEGLVAAKGPHAKLYNSVGAGPSRFKKEVRISRIIPQRSTGSADDHHDVTTKPGRVGRRRHSFDHQHHRAERTSDMYDRKLSSSFRSYTSPSCTDFDDGTVDDEAVAAKHEEGRNTNSCQNEACSLLDKFEVEAVCKQLHDRLRPSCRSPRLSAELRENVRGSQKAHHDHPQEHLKPHRYIKSCSTTTHKPSADNDHNHNINDAVRRLLHLHMKMSSSHSTSTAPAVPFFCSSIATANSIVDPQHHHRRSPKHSKAPETPINRTAKRHGVLYNWGIRENVGKVPNYSEELKLADKVSAAAADDQHERGDLTLGQHKSQQKLDVRTYRDHELVGEGASAPPSSPHSSDSKFSKAFLPLVSHLPRLSALALSHHKHAHKSSKDDGVLVLACSNRHRQLHGEHVHHIHHHHHHYYHHLQQTNEASAQDARCLLRDYYLEGHAGAHELQVPKIYRLHKEKLMISGAADHGREGRPQHHEYIAAPGRLQAAGKFKAEKYLWPAAHRAAAGTDHVDLQPPGAPLLTF